jgi:hypothetical protein
MEISSSSTSENNDEARMTKSESQIDIAASIFAIRYLAFFRHSSFIILHSPRGNPGR